MSSAPHYAAPVMYHATRRADVLPAADAAAGALSEILPGDGFELLEVARSFCWGMCCADGSVGFVATDALVPGPGPILALATATELAGEIELLIGVPWNDGGRSVDGVDAAGLVFLALQRTGTVALRFLDLQAATLGAELAADAVARRGDLIFFDKHVAVMIDGDQAVHAEPHAAVASASLASIVAAHGPITVRRRMA